MKRAVDGPVLLWVDVPEDIRETMENKMAERRRVQREKELESISAKLDAVLSGG